MCDVDEEAVVAAVDAPSIYDIPKVLHREGLDAYVVRRLEPAVPRRRLDRVGRPAAPGAPPGRGGHRRAGRQVHRPARRLPLGRRGAARRRVRPRGQGAASAGCPPTSAQTTEGAARAPRRRRRGLRARRLRRPRASRARSARCSTPATHGIPTLGLCLGLQCMVIEYARNVAGLAKAGSTEFDAGHPAAGHRHDGRAARRRRGRAATWAARCGSGLYPAELAEGTRRARGVRRRRGSTSGTGTATRSTTPTATQLEEAGLVFSGTSPDGSLVEFVELPRDVHPYYVAHPGAPRAAVPPDPAAPAVRRADRRGRRPAAGAARSRSTRPALRRSRVARRPRRDRAGRATPADPSGSRDRPERVARPRRRRTCSAARRCAPCAATTRRRSGAATRRFSRDVVEHPGAVGVLAARRRRSGCSCSGSTATRRGRLLVGAARRAAATWPGRTAGHGAGASWPRRPRYEAGAVDALLARSHTSPGISSERIELFLARGAHARCRTGRASSSSTRRPT